MARAAPPPGRGAMIAAAAGLFARRGVEATSFTDVLRESGASRGSIYYYFPAGKQELVEEAVRWTTEVVLAHQRRCRARSPAGVVRHFVGFFRRSLQASGCRNGCPLAAVAVGTFAPPQVLRDVVRPGFRAWESLLSSQLHAVGLPAREARSLARTVLASVEGALILARAESSLRPLDEVDRQLRRLTAA